MAPLLSTYRPLMRVGWVLFIGMTAFTGLFVGWCCWTFLGRH